MMPFTSENAAAFHCPRWDALPAIPLYMDQVLLILEDSLSPLLPDEPPATAAMINNYVKQKLLSAPVKKKYGREHLASLMMICVLKRVLSIPEIAGLRALLASEQGDAACYDLFCAELESALAFAFHGFSDVQTPKQSRAQTALRAALVAFAGKLALQSMLCSAKEA